MAQVYDEIVDGADGFRQRAMSVKGKDHLVHMLPAEETGDGAGVELSTFGVVLDADAAGSRSFDLKLADGAGQGFASGLSVDSLRMDPAMTTDC